MRREGLTIPEWLVVICVLWWAIYALYQAAPSY